MPTIMVRRETCKEIYTESGTLKEIKQGLKPFVEGETREGWCEKEGKDRTIKVISVV